jgi:hypothetical protein
MLKWCLLLTVLLQGSLMSRGQEAPFVGRTAIGDWGHFVSMAPIAYLNNPTGRDFQVAVRVMGWVMLKWTPTDLPLLVTPPGAKEPIRVDLHFEDNSAIAQIPGQGTGAYRVELGPDPKGRAIFANLFFESDLPQSVLMAAVPEKYAAMPADSALRPAYFQASVPRRWWFWVPADCQEFSMQAKRSGKHMSQREDWGLSIFSPRGQREKILWGQPRVFPKRENYEATESVTVQVEPGSAGRFWYVEVRLGDSHNYSNLNLALSGVPAWLARSPEEWFDPETGKVPPVSAYDEARFMQAARNPEDLFQHWSPCPALGDPDGNFVRGDGRFALWNPENRPLLFALGDYLPRLHDGQPPVAQLRITDAQGKVLVERPWTLEHYHDKRDPWPMPPTGATVLTATVTGVEHWLAFSYPATPLVLLGEAQPEGWQRFNLEVGTARNYYFRVPAETTSFKVRTSTANADQVLDLEVNAPDRTMARIFGQKGEAEVRVPPGLAGKLWHLRLDIGGSSRLVTQGPPETMPYQGLILALDLQGVPGLLSPTWEQWFDPAQPKAALAR